MKTISLEEKQARFLQSINWQLFVILLLMVACFFTWSENIIITRAIKVVGRMGVLFASYLVYKRIITFGAVDSFKWKNSFSFGLYIVYLTEGFFFVYVEYQCRL